MLYHYNLAAGGLVSATGARLSDRPSIMFATAPVWTIRFCDVSAGEVTPIDVTAAVAWRAAVDRDHSTATEPMIRTLNENIDATAAAGGEITVRLDADTETFLAAADGKERLAAWFELWGLSGTGEAVYYARFPIWTGMPIDPASGEAPSPPAEQWADKTYVEARLNAGDEIEFSDDGDTWYPLELDENGDPIMPVSARWWHYRNRLTGGAWSDRIPLLPGVPGTGLAFAPNPAYDPATVYANDPATGYNACTDQGGVWLYVNAEPGSGNAPPALPATSNAHWSLIVAPGQQGIPGADGTDGQDGQDGQDGNDGQDGDTPEIGPNGNWFTGGIDTGISASGPAGIDGQDGNDGTGLNFRGAFNPAADPPYQMTVTAKDAVQDQGCTWAYINETPSNNAPPAYPAASNDYWSLVVAKGQDGTDGTDGADGQDGQDGNDGQDGDTPEIGPNGNWFIGGIDTGIPASGPAGGLSNPTTLQDDEDVTTPTAPAVTPFLREKAEGGVELAVKKSDGSVELVAGGGSGSGGVPAVAVSEPDPEAGTIEVRPVDIDPVTGATSWAGEAVTAFYTWGVPNE